MTDTETAAAAATGTTTAANTAAAGTLAADPAFSKFDAETQGFFKNKGWDAKPHGEVLGALANSYREAEKFLGAPKDELVRLPKATDAEAVKAFRLKIGAGEKPEDYDFKDVKYADGTELNEDFVTMMRNTFVAKGVAKDDALEIVKSVVKFIDDSDASEATVRLGKIAAANDELRKSWGNNMEANTFIAKQAAAKLGLDKEVLEAMEQVSPVKFAQALLKIGQMMGEDNFVKSPAHGKGVMTTDQAAARLSQLTADTAWAAKLAAGDTAALAEFDALTRMQIA